MRTTITIDDELYRRAKARAARTGQTVSQVIEDAVREALRPHGRGAAPLRALPVFRGGGLRPGVDLTDNAALRDVMDEGTPPRALR